MTQTEESFAPQPTLEETETEEEAYQEPDKPKTDRKTEPREYVVFEQVGADTFKIVSRVLANNADEARKSIGKEKLQDTHYAAVTARSWRPEKPKVTTKTVISFE